MSDENFRAEFGGYVPDRPFRWGINVWKSIGSSWTDGYLMNSRVPTSSWRFSNISFSSARPVENVSVDLCFRGSKSNMTTYSFVRPNYQHVPWMSQLIFTDGPVPWVKLYFLGRWTLKIRFKNVSKNVVHWKSHPSRMQNCVQNGITSFLFQLILLMKSRWIRHVPRKVFIFISSQTQFSSEFSSDKMI